MILRRRRPRAPAVSLEVQPDDLPKAGLFTEPVRVASLHGLDPETLPDGRYRVTFLAEVRDADDRRCPDLSVEAVVSGPVRSGRAQGTTDLLGRIRFRTTGPVGSYGCDITDVAAGGLAWDRDASADHAGVDVR